MNKAFKGALAAGAGSVLLLGGAGTLAFWTDTETVTGGAVNSGHLRLVTDATNTGCGDWLLDSGEDVAQTYTDGNPLVPGDVLTKVCNYTIEAEGNHLRATVGISTPNITVTSTNSFGTTLTVDVSDLKVGGSAATSFDEADDGATLTATVTVTFAGTATNVTQDVDGALANLALTATQVHA